MTYDGAAAATCLGGFFSTCDRSFLATARARAEACDHMFTATGGDMALCGIDQECISGFCSLTANCMGTCSGSMPPPPRPKLGESCTMNSDCIDSYCDGSTQVCTTYLRSGEPTTSDADCQPGLAMRNGLCAALAATGESCSSASDCESVGDYCSGTCTKVGLTGAMCVGDNECGPYYHCDTVSHACALLPTRGQNCTPNGQLGCIDNSYCDTTTSVCIALLPDGATCTQSSDCLNDFCDFSTSPGTCTSQPVCF